MTPDGESEEAETTARDALAEDLAKRVIEVGVVCEALQRQWVTAAQRTDIIRSTSGVCPDIVRSTCRAKCEA